MLNSGGRYTFDDIQKLESGDELWESSQLSNLFIEVARTPYLDGDRISFLGQVIRSEKSVINGQLIDYMMLKSHPHYGPSLYNEPQYVVMPDHGNVALTFGPFKYE
jgi:hypothetical protein